MTLDLHMKQAWESSLVKGVGGYEDFITAYNLEEDQIDRILETIVEGGFAVYRKVMQDTDDRKEAFEVTIAMVACRAIAFGMQLEIERTLDGTPTVPREGESK